MNSATYRAIKAILATDDSIRPDQRDTVLAVLNERVPKAGPLPLLLTQRQAAELLGVSRFTVRRMTQDGELHPVQVHGRLRYRRNEIESLATGR